MYQDTIAAISTPIGEGGIGIVRLSGDNARQIAAKIFDKPLINRRLVHGYIIDPDSTGAVDEVLASYMAAPHTYTREDVVEINCHGGVIPLQQILGLVLKNGARSAEPGEFTLRAFLNGRIDLTQAESVQDIIQAKTQASLRLAVEGLKGKLSIQIGTLRNDLLSALAYLTARIDFPEDEVEEQDAFGPISKAREELKSLIAGADAGAVYRQGIRTAIVGRPNVGKSSLLNRLMRESRAIVTPVPGTTRDTIEEVVNLKGVPFVLVDTAGITESHDMAESLGIERSRTAIDQASLIVLVIDTSEPVTDADWQIIKLLDNKTVVIAANKDDLPAKAKLEEINWPTIHTSALTGNGIDELETKLADIALGGKLTAPDEFMVTNVRHKEALQRAEAHLSEALNSMENNMPDDFVTIDLTGALNALGEITGETVTEELLEIIFSSFCVGK
ncbi:MAG: tRNA uridine-5-carboxymethylaminomethyl(34) synthesis GTPase MnmE [Chloroflexi bacterium]|jgi:tRNA modification GTPase|nr:tRNA uridine-5-carboxymethylaminomethyl(34) synthesis GTPase MnmE [Chloroflexota bacterium]